MGNNFKLEEVPVEDIFNLYDEPVRRFRIWEGPLIYEAEITDANSHVTVSCAAEDKEEITEVIIKPDIEIKGKKYPVNYIGICGFKDCVNLRKVEIPEGIKKIFAGAFAETVLEEIRLPDSLKYIGFGAFSGCENLKKVSLPSGCEINGDPFAGCNKALIVETY